MPRSCCDQRRRGHLPRTGFLSRRADPTKELASAIARRGVRVRGTIESIAFDGDLATARVRFRPEGATNEIVATATHNLAQQSRVGLEPDAPVTLSYDRDDPQTVLIWGSPRYGTTESGAVVRVVDVEGGERE
jgi:hypothetical protein